MNDRNCKEITTGYELVVVECGACGFHMGLDASYLEQVGSVGVDCPSCGIGLRIGSNPPGEDAPAETQQAFIAKKLVTKAQQPGVWDEDPQFPSKDWKYQVDNGDTRLGYWDWVADMKQTNAEREAAEDEQ